MATLVGMKIVFGSGINATAGIITASKLYVQNAEYNLRSGKSEITDENGEVRGVVYHGESSGLQVTCVPFDSSSESTAASNFNLPAIGTKVTITADGIEGAGGNEFAGTNWIFEGGTKRIRNDGVAEMTVTLTKYPNVS